MKDLKKLRIKKLVMLGDKMKDHQQLNSSLYLSVEFQTAMQKTMMLLLLLSRNNTMMLNCTDKIKLMLKKLLINGEKDGLQAQDQLLTL
jgi:hypothetical protein